MSQQILYRSGGPLRPHAQWLPEVGWHLLDLRLARRSVTLKIGRLCVRWTFRPATDDPL